MSNKRGLFAFKEATRTELSGADRLVQTGLVSFSGTDTTVEVSTDLTSVEWAVALSSSAAEALFCDRTVTSGAVTISRAAAGASGMEVQYMFIGHMQA